MKTYKYVIVNKTTGKLTRTNNWIKILYDCWVNSRLYNHFEDKHTI